MAINTLTIVQDNKVGDSNLLPIHSPLSFIIRAGYTGDAPDKVYVQLLDIDNTLLDTFNAIPFRDVTTNARDFIFIASGIIKGYMPEFDDILQAIESFDYIGNLTQLLKLKFVSPDDSNVNTEITIDFCNAAKQFSQAPNLSEQYNNEADIYYAPEGFLCYVYFYNKSVNDTIEVNETALTFGIAADYNDDSFVDFDDSEFEILTR